MKKLLLILFAISLVGCSSDDDSNEKKHPSLKIVNQNEYLVITNVSLVGYEFSSLNIQLGDEQTFALEDGMPAGYEDINVELRWTCGAMGWTGSIELDFSADDTTTIVVTECPNGGGTCREEVCLN